MKSHVGLPAAAVAGNRIRHRKRDDDLCRSVAATPTPTPTVVFMPLVFVVRIFRLDLLLLLVLRCGGGGVFGLFFGHDVFKLRPKRLD